MKFRQTRRTRKSWYQRAKPYLSTAWNVAKKAYHTAQFVKSIVNAEMKHLETTQTAQSISYNGTVYHLTAISEGDTSSTRNGNSVKIKNVMCNFQIKGNTNYDTNSMRVIIFRDTMNAGTTPAPGDLLQTTGTELAPLSGLKDTVGGRYKIMYSKIFTTSKTGQHTLARKVFLKTNFHVRYTSTSGTDEWKNQVYIMFIADVGTNDPSISFFARVGYYDN